MTEDEIRDLIVYAGHVISGQIGNRDARAAQERRERDLRYPRRVSVINGFGMPMPCGPWHSMDGPRHSHTCPGSVTFDFSKD